MTVAAAELKVSLVCRVGDLLCAFPVGQITEIMRPLPLEAFPGAPHFVGGVSIVRGAPLPVVMLSRLFEKPERHPERLLVARAGLRRVGLAIDEFVGFRAMAAADLEGLPPLLSEASEVAAAQIGRLDSELLVVLEAANIVTDEVFTSIEASPIPS